MFRIPLLLLLLSCFSAPLTAQVFTSEDSLAAGLRADDRKTYLSGYGELKVQYDMALNTGTANLTRNVLFVGHRFNRKLSFFSEMEPENASVEGGAMGGELSMEQPLPEVRHQQGRLPRGRPVHPPYRYHQREPPAHHLQRQ
ncbi:MAG: hypothetical protein IPN38_04440 [Flavobacteriales bacterium]|nr:hypothetical protein [Flavobacteriales bacterium]